MTNKDLIEPIEHINAMCKCLRDLGCVSCPLFEQEYGCLLVGCFPNNWDIQKIKTALD